MFFARFAGLVLVATLAIAGAEPASDTLTIASEGARPPFNYLDADNQLAGFEIELGRELCRRLHRTCSFVTQDWDGLIPGLLAHQYDALMAALDITEERRAKIAFSIPYLRMPASFAVGKDSALKEATPAALAGKTVGVEEGSASQGLMEVSYPGVKANA